MTKFEQAIQLIDEKNAMDPHTTIVEEKEYPTELLYSLRMSQKLGEFEPEASNELRIAARAQHICRWKIQRCEFEMTRAGYLNWREELKKMHAQITAELLLEIGYDPAFIERVSFLIKKKFLKKDEGTQTLEDVICLVFLQFYLEEFAAKHSEEKLIDIIRKTWGKMSAKGHEAALKLPLSPKMLALVTKSLS